LPADSAFGSRTIPYFKQAANTANLVLGYEKDQLDVRLAANYRDKYLDGVGVNALSDRYTSDYVQIDLTGKYRVNDHLVIKAAALNLNDRPEFYYFGNTQRLSQYDEFGTTYEIGMSYEL
jgi:outer membrane receptor protein involved in Fe transport